VFERVFGNAQEIGMRINHEKTQLLCISKDRSVVNSAELRPLNGGVISSINKMKMLGYILNDQGTAEDHITEIESKFHRKLWIIRNLKKAGASHRDMLVAYKSMIRPVLEYASVVFHSLLYIGQEERLERLQYRAIKTIFGWTCDYDEACEQNGLESLKTRRIAAIDKFVTKAEKSSRFSKWFELNDCEQKTRGYKKYKEKSCRTDAFYRSPINFYTRRLNELYSLDR
jgi:hypothetical protein